ncbi:hypothetical protein BGZ65_004770, partial [Modicella reniformis]
MERHVGYLCAMLEAMITDVDRAITTVKLLAPAERDLLLRTWNETEKDYPAHQCVHHIFEEQVERTPQVTALVFNDESLTYAELNARDNRLAHHPFDLGVQPDMRVAICVERSFAMIVGVLAILKAGGAYVPLDPAYASERLRATLVDAATAVVVADNSGRAAIGEESLSILTVVDPNTVLNVCDGTDRHNKDNDFNPRISGLTSHHLAYVIYTSGSTGKPKGVLIEHQGVVNLIYGRREMFGILSSSRVLQFTSLSFDHSVSEIFLSLSFGASLHLVRDDIRLDHNQLYNYLQQSLITHVSLTPALLQDANELPVLNTLSTLIVMGEALPAALLRVLKPLVPNGRIINGYGPTEITVGAIAWKCPQTFDDDIVPIGRPTPNKKIYILDQHRKPVPLGAIGELYIGGAGVARGYLNQVDLTDKMFVQDPFTLDASARMYKTGDMARYLPDGNILFLGRNDHQVKIRGFRIELGEIEARLTDNPLVEKAVVIAAGEGNDKRLVAYIVAKHDDQLVHALRVHLASCLPDYMVPAAIVRMDSMPLTSNGKLDRKDLPVPDSHDFAREVYEEPQGKMETAVAHIWSELLHVDRVSRNDNFFALGGHSLLAVRFMNRMNRLGIQFPLSVLFASPCLSSFAGYASQHLAQGVSALSTITPISRDGDLPLSFSQQRMWFLAQLEGVSETYHMQMAVRLRGDLNSDAWQGALNTLFARHEALRSVFVTVDGEPRVRLLSAQSGIPICWKDLRGQQDAEAQLERISAEEASAPFDLSKGPLIRVHMVQLDNNEYFFMLNQHHIISDGWSTSILYDELSTLYCAYCKGESDPLPPLSIQYPDYAAWQRQMLSGERLETHSSYWRTALTDAPVLLDLPTDRPRPTQQSFTGNDIQIRVDPQLTQALKNVSQKHGTTLYMTILAAWSAVLSRLSGQDDIIIGSPTASRNNHQIESLIGFFVNTLALRVDLSGDPTVSQLLERVRSTTLDAQEHQDLPFEQVVDIVQPPRSLSHSPLFQVMFVWQNNEEWDWKLPSLESADVGSSYEFAKFDLTLHLYESLDEITGSLGYSTALFDHSTMERHVGYLCAMLEAVTTDMDRAITTVELLAPVESDLLLRTWNETEKDYPAHQCIHHIFEEQVERAPQATALVFKDQSLTYAELNTRANRLAHHLIELGVQPDMRVAICVERSFAMIVGVLAVLKAGGAYVPLDPNYPEERLAYILEDTQLSIALVDATGRGIINGASQHLSNPKDIASIVMIDPAVSLSSPSTNPHVSTLASHHLAYIVYTSGSTGRPKGVMIEHRGVVNYALSRIEDYGLDDSSRVLQFSSLNFDLSVIETFTAFYSGASLHLLDDRTRLDRIELWAYLERHSITQAVLPPAILQECKECKPLNTRLNLISCGEELPASLLRALHPLVPNGAIINEYGPSETAIGDTAWRCPSEGFGGDTVPVGRPLANKRIYILDKHGRPVPLGAIGELYIGGVGVGRGYLNRPDLTAKVFLPDPFA